MDRPAILGQWRWRASGGPRRGRKGMAGPHGRLSGPEWGGWCGQTERAVKKRPEGSVPGARPAAARRPWQARRRQRTSRASTSITSPPRLRERSGSGLERIRAGALALAPVGAHAERLAAHLGHYVQDRHGDRGGEHEHQRHRHADQASAANRTARRKRMRGFVMKVGCKTQRKVPAYPLSLGDGGQQKPRCLRNHSDMSITIEHIRAALRARKTRIPAWIWAYL